MNKDLERVFIIVFQSLKDTEFLVTENPEDLADYIDRKNLRIIVLKFGMENQ